MRLVAGAGGGGGARGRGWRAVRSWRAVGSDGAEGVHRRRGGGGDARAPAWRAREGAGAHLGAGISFCPSSNWSPPRVYPPDPPPIGPHPGYILLTLLHLVPTQGISS
eukprot:755108-Prorocentrum_minimum.AAC.1